MRSFSCVISVRRPFMEAVDVCCNVERAELGSEEDLWAAILQHKR